MGFLKKLFGGGERDASPEKPYVDTQGIYLYVRCDRCGTPVRLRADKQYDLINDEDGFVWHKTIVDNRCFRPMPTVVRFNAAYEMVSHEITGGRYITKEDYESLIATREIEASSADEASAGHEPPAEGG
jgi:hypothetical protein